MMPMQDHSNHADGNGPAKSSDNCLSCEALKAEMTRLKGYPETNLGKSRGLLAL